jgi:hypothetical protein
MQIQDSINLENACNGLESVARQLPLRSPELGAIELAAHALILLTEPRAHAEPNESPSVDDLRRSMRDWSSQGERLEAYIASWKEHVTRNGTDEQRGFIAYIDESETTDFASNADGFDLETRPVADRLPTPSQAIRILEALAQHYPAADTLNSVRVELAIYTLRYTVEHDHVAALERFLDDAEKRHEPFEHA